ncbi:MAG: hypothetical protein AAFZ87_11640, partial [Planctomycetota bacterium]
GGPVSAPDGPEHHVRASTEQEPARLRGSVPPRHPRQSGEDGRVELERPRSVVRRPLVRARRVRSGARLALPLFHARSHRREVRTARPRGPARALGTLAIR